jgi:F-type H+-transporting ATPase subunit c
MFSSMLMLAQEAVASTIGVVGIGIGMGLVVVGAGIGIGRIGGEACAGIARQPEASGKISTNMIIAAALVEGLSFFAVIMLYIK